MRIVTTARFRLAQMPPDMGGGAPPPPGAPPGTAPMMPPPAPPSKYLFHNAGKNGSGEWGAYFTMKDTGEKFFAPERQVRELASKNLKENKPDKEISTALARIEAAKLNEISTNNDFNFEF